MNFMKYFRTPFYRVVPMAASAYASAVNLTILKFWLNVGNWKSTLERRWFSLNVKVFLTLVNPYSWSLILNTKRLVILSVIYNNTSGDILWCILSAKVDNILCVLNPRSLTLWSASVWKASSNIYKGSRPEALRVKDVFKNFTKFTREYLRRRHQTCNFIKKEAPTGVFYCEFLRNF